MSRLRDKLSVEAGRLVVHLKALMTWPLEPYRMRQHDRAILETAIQTPGHCPLGLKVAIYLIYQPKGLLPSTIETCRVLAESGYGVLVMSNAPLSLADNAKLAPFTYLVVERPNFGYDFGGYRDGVRLLRALGTQPKALIVLNDSVWWPVMDGDPLISHMEEAGADVVGTILHHLSPRNGRPRPPFLESYLYWFGPNALASDAFWLFWDRYRVSNLKYNAIHRGERKLTGILRDAGLRVTGLFSASALIEALRVAGPDEQTKALIYAAFIDSVFAEKAQALLAVQQKDVDWSEQMLNFIGEVTKKRIFHPTFPYASMKFLQANYLKKTPTEPKTSVHYIMRARVLEAIAAGDLPEPLSEIKIEIEQRQVDGALAVGR